MKYSIKEMKELYDIIEARLNEEERLVMKQMLENYNKLFIYAKEKKEYIERKQKQYVKESDENDKLKLKNMELEEKVYSQRCRIDNLVKEVKFLNKKLKE